MKQQLSKIHRTVNEAFDFNQTNKDSDRELIDETQFDAIIHILHEKFSKSLKYKIQKDNENNLVMSITYEMFHLHKEQKSRFFPYDIIEFIQKKFGINKFILNCDDQGTTSLSLKQNVQNIELITDNDTFLIEMHGTTLVDNVTFSNISDEPYIDISFTGAGNLVGKNLTINAHSFFTDIDISRLTDSTFNIHEFGGYNNNVVITGKLKK